MSRNSLDSADRTDSDEGSGSSFSKAVRLNNRPYEATMALTLERILSRFSKPMMQSLDASSASSDSKDAAHGAPSNIKKDIHVAKEELDALLRQFLGNVLTESEDVVHRAEELARKSEGAFSKVDKDAVGKMRVWGKIEEVLETVIRIVAE